MGLRVIPTAPGLTPVRHARASRTSWPGRRPSSRAERQRKSTLINLLVPGAQAEVGEVSRAGTRAATTTTTALVLDRRGRATALIDSPGFQEFGLRHIAAGQLAGLMPDLREHSRDLPLYNCTHIHEPDAACGALARGEIDESRYRIYPAQPEHRLGPGGLAILAGTPGTARNQAVSRRGSAVLGTDGFRGRNGPAAFPVKREGRSPPGEPIHPTRLASESKASSSIHSTTERQTSPTTLRR